MGILRILLLAMAILVICLVYLPTTKHEKRLERKIIKGTIWICLIIIISFSIILISFSDSLFSDSDNQQRLASRIQLSSNETTNILKLTKYDATNFAAKTIIQVLTKNPNITTLNLSEIPIAKAKEFQELLTAIDNILHLELTNITPTSLDILLQGIAKAKNLQSLKIEHSTLNEENLNNLNISLQNNNNIKQLKLLQLTMPKDNVKWITNIITTTNTQQISLASNNLGDANVNAIIQAMKNNNILLKLDLWNNSIGDATAANIGELLKQNTTLQELNLGYNNFSDQGVKTIITSLHDNKTLKLLELTRNAALTDATVDMVLQNVPTTKDIIIKITSAKISNPKRKALAARFNFESQK